MDSLPVILIGAIVAGAIIVIGVLGSARDAREDRARAAYYEAMEAQWEEDERRAAQRAALEEALLQELAEELLEIGVECEDANLRLPVDKWGMLEQSMITRVADVVASVRARHREAGSPVLMGLRCYAPDGHPGMDDVWILVTTRHDHEWDDEGALVHLSVPDQELVALWRGAFDTLYILVGRDRALEILSELERRATDASDHIRRLGSREWLRPDMLQS